MFATAEASVRAAQVFSLLWGQRSRELQGIDFHGHGIARRSRQSSRNLHAGLSGVSGALVAMVSLGQRKKLFSLIGVGEGAVHLLRK